MSIHTKPNKIEIGSLQINQWGNQKKLFGSYIYFLQRTSVKQSPEAQGTF